MLSTAIFTDVINSYLAEPHASLLNGILFGIPIRTNQLFYSQVKMVGLLHIVVLSGINITIISSVILNLTNIFSKKISILITMLTIIGFISFVGVEAPIIRAGFMGIVTLVAILFGRKNLAIYSLLLSVIFTAVFWPKLISSISFQLSYAATLGIVLFGKVTDVKATGLFNKAKLIIWKDLKPSLAAQLFTVPLLFYHFRELSLIAPISNLFISFVIPPLMVFGFLTAFLGKISFVLGLLPSWVSYALLSYIIFIIDLLSQIPFIYFKL